MISAFRLLLVLVGKKSSGFSSEVLNNFEINLVAVLVQISPSTQRYHVSCYSCNDCPEVLAHSRNVHRHSGCITCLKEVYYGITSRRCVKGHVDTCVAQTTDNLIRRCCNNFDLCNRSAKTSSPGLFQSVLAGILALVLFR